jgi:hypothetical protein
VKKRKAEDDEPFIRARKKTRAQRGSQLPKREKGVKKKGPRGGKKGMAGGKAMGKARGRR